MPNIPETYVHRIGRTGRAGASGIALSFCDEEEIDFLKDIHKLIAKQIPVEEGHPYPMSVQSFANKPVDAAKKSGAAGGRSGGGPKRGRGYGRDSRASAGSGMSGRTNDRRRV